VCRPPRHPLPTCVSDVGFPFRSFCRTTTPMPRIADSCGGMVRSNPSFFAYFRERSTRKRMLSNIQSYLPDENGPKCVGGLHTIDVGCRSDDVLSSPPEDPNANQKHDEPYGPYPLRQVGAHKHTQAFTHRHYHVVYHVSELSSKGSIGRNSPGGPCIILSVVEGVTRVLGFGSLRVPGEEAV
jgi:hypothetical protein